MEKNFTSILLRKLWNQEFYQDQSRKATLEGFASQNEFLLKLKKYVKKADKILDCGCGSASVLEGIWQKNCQFYGVDISEMGIKMAKERLKKKKNIKLAVANIEKLEFKDNFFDLVYAISLLEHLANPEKAIKEMIRVTKKGGFLVFLSPNFGSPFYPSSCHPPGLGARLARLFKILLKSHLYLMREPKNLDWVRVYPKYLKEKDYQSDWDTVVEPYLQTLIIFLGKNQFKSLESYSTFQAVIGRIPREILNNSSLSGKASLISRRAALLMEKIGLPPYRYFGPSLFLAAQKT